MPEPTVTDRDRELAVGVLDRWDEYEGTVEEMMAELSAQARQEGREESPYDHRAVAMQGLLHFEYEYSPDGLLKFPVGWAETDTGLTALHALHSALESLSGKIVRVSIEWNDQPAPEAKE